MGSSQRANDVESVSRSWCHWNPPVTNGFPTQRASDSQIVSISWRHRMLHVLRFHWSPPHLVITSRISLWQFPSIPRGIGTARIALNATSRSLWPLRATTRYWGPQDTNNNLWLGSTTVWHLRLATWRWRCSRPTQVWGSMRMRRECWERFPCQRLKSKLLVSYSGIHHGTYVTAIWQKAHGLLVGYIQAV